MKQCAECNSPVFSKGLCTKHWKIKYGKTIKRTPLKKKVNKVWSEQKRKPIRKVSRKQAKVLNEYRGVKSKHYRDELDSEGYIACKGCGGVAESNHHVKGKVGKDYCDPTHFLPLCIECHDWVESHPEEAKALGLSKSRLTK